MELKYQNNKSNTTNQSINFIVVLCSIIKIQYHFRNFLKWIITETESPLKAAREIQEMGALLGGDDVLIVLISGGKALLFRLWFYYSL